MPVKKDKTVIGHLPQKCRVFVRCFSEEGGLSIVESVEAKDILAINLREDLRFPVR